MIYEYQEKVLHIHMSSILHGVLVGAGSLGLRFHMEVIMKGAFAKKKHLPLMHPRPQVTPSSDLK